MSEAALLERAIGESGRRVSAEPFGEGVIVRFKIDEGPNAGDWFVDTSRTGVVRETGFVVRSQRGVVARIWRHPLDPRLPALRTALDTRKLARIAAAGGSRGEVDAAVLAYRPGRRAVVRLTQEGTHRFIKIVRPGEAEDLVQLHKAARAAEVPAPEIVHWSPSGVVVVRDAVGTPGPVAAARTEPEALLDAIDDLRERFTRVATKRPARASVGVRAEWHVARIAELLPGRASEIARLRGLISQSLRREGKPVSVHGDLHIGQLFFEDGSVSSVIDIDTAGLGDPADDTAAFIGHATASAERNKAAGRNRDAQILERVAEAASTRWIRDPHSSALTALHCVAHGIRAAGRPGSTERLFDAALEIARLP